MLYHTEARYPGSPRATSDIEIVVQQQQEQQLATTIRDKKAEETLATATQNIQKAQQKQMADYDRRRPMDHKLLDSGTLILIKKRKRGSKLEFKCEGPYRLVAYSSNHTTVLIEDQAGRQWTENISHITPYLGPEEGNDC